jgi:ATP phosphoribosyltransferase
MTKPLILALPKGRILDELLPLLEKAGIIPEADFFNPKSRKLHFTTNDAGLEIIRVRSFDVATFVAFGAAQLGVAGSDVVAEFDHIELYAPLDLGIGHCRLVVAAHKDTVDDNRQWSHVRVATKYPRLTSDYFAKRGVQAECIKLHGAMELAPNLGLCRRIVDLVSTGSTLHANNLVEIEEIMPVSSKLIVNRTSTKTMGERLNPYVQRFREAVCPSS